MSGLRYAALRTGAGRPTGKARKVADVEELACPKRDGGLPHVLRNAPDRGGLVTACVGCGETWTALDAAAREAGLR